MLIVPVAAYMVGSALGVGSVTLIYTNDLLPPKGVGLCLAVQWSFTALVGKVVPILIKK